MSKKPLFRLKVDHSGNHNPDVFSPFWVKPKNKTSKLINIAKQIWKWSKIFVLLFFFVMGMWGCFQTSFDPSVASSQAIGSGLEFGFSFGTTNLWAYDLSSSPLQEYHTFNRWSMQYGPFYGWFVWPGAWLTLNITWAGHAWWGGLNGLLGILVLIIIIRILTMLATVKSTLQNEKMSEVNGKLSEINAKYKGLKDSQSKQMKQQEIMDLYKKNNIHPFAAFEQILITLPIFLIIYRVVTILRPLKATVLFNIWNFSYTPTTQLFSNFIDGGWTYLFFLIIVIPVQFLSTWLPTRWAKHRNRQAQTASSKGKKENKKRMMFQYVFTGAMSLIVAFTPTGVGVYWFFNALFSILQSYIMHVIILKQREKKFKSSVGRIELS
ncbi:MAG: membrane protein insertase YidC [Mycoplasma sp.]